MCKDNAIAKVKGIGKRRPRGKSLGKDGNELRNKTARAWYEMALFRATRRPGRDRGARRDAARHARQRDHYTQGRRRRSG
jgi:hypothetical protein